MARIIYEAIATVRKYKDKETGEERKHYQKCGTVFESGSGKLSLKLDTIPVTPGWSGFLSLVPPRPRGEMPDSAEDPPSAPAEIPSGITSPPAGRAPRRSAYQNGAAPPPATDEPEDDAPF